MKEVILVIFVTFSGDQGTELYEFPMDSIDTCITTVSKSQVASGVSAFCVQKSPKADK